MFNSIARRSIVVLSKKSPAFAACKQSVLVGSNIHRRTFAEKVPDEDYYDGHLMTEHLEYLDDMLDKTLEIEKSLEDLKLTYDKKRQAMSTMSAESSYNKEEMEVLFNKAAEQKAAMSVQIANLKTILMNAHTTAIDAPDGTSDAELRAEFKEVNRIIDHAAKFEDTDAVNKKHKIEEKIQKERARDPEHDW